MVGAGSTPGPRTSGTGATQKSGGSETLVPVPTLKMTQTYHIVETLNQLKIKMIKLNLTNAYLNLKVDKFI